MSIKSLVTFGKNVHRLRKQRNMTQEKLAEYADISVRYLQRIETGTANPGIHVVYRIHCALKCKWEALLQDVYGLTP